LADQSADLLITLFDSRLANATMMRFRRMIIVYDNGSSQFSDCDHDSGCFSGGCAHPPLVANVGTGTVVSR
jgi:hypothetical protein